MADSSRNTASLFERYLQNTLLTNETQMVHSFSYWIFFGMVSPRKKAPPKNWRSNKNKHFLFGSLGLNSLRQKVNCDYAIYKLDSEPQVETLFLTESLQTLTGGIVWTLEGPVENPRDTGLGRGKYGKYPKKDSQNLLSTDYTNKNRLNQEQSNWFSKDTIDYDIVHSLNSIISYQFAQMPIPLPASERCLLREVRFNANACQADDSQYTSKRIHSSSHPKASFRTGGMLNQKRLRMLLNKVSRCWWAPHIWAKNKCKVEKSCYLILWNLKACTDLVTLKSKRSMF